MAAAPAPRVVRVLTRLNAGGITAHVLTQAIHGIQGYEQVIVAGEIEENEVAMLPLLRRLATPPVILPELRRAVSPTADLRALRGLLRLLREVRPAIVETHASKAGSIGRTAVAIHNRFRRRRGEPPVRVVHYFHGHVFRGDYFSPRKTRTFLGMERWLGRSATDVIVVPCTQQRDELAGEFAVAPVDRFRIVPYGIEIGLLTADMERHRLEFREQLGLAPDDVAVGIVGRLEPVKDHALFLSAAAHALDAMTEAQRGPVRFLVVGDGALRPGLERQAAELGLGDRVRFIGHRHDRERFLAGLDVVALSSRNEGYPFALIEAMAFGRAIVSTRAGGVQDLVRDGETGLLTPVGDAPALGAALARVLADAGLRARLGAAAAREMHNRHDVTTMLDGTRALYDELVAITPAGDR